MEKYFFENSDSEVCYNKKYFDIHMQEEGLTEMSVFEAIPDKIKGIFWCRKHKFCGDDSTVTCGKQCKEYAPRNGRSGCCKFYSTGIYIQGDKVKITPTNNSN